VTYYAECRILALTAALAGTMTSLALAQPQPQPAPPKVEGAWMNTSLSPDERADLAIAQMTLDEKIQLVHGVGGRASTAPRSNGGVGMVAGIARLGLPDLQMADSAVGVRAAAERGRYSTLLPSNIGEAATWDPKLAFAYGKLIGRELRDQMYNVSLGGGVDITREPRNGRNFEYLGEDPVLAGKMVAQWIRGLQSQNVIGDVKHYAFNDQETGRSIGNVKLGKRTMRETDLLAFEIAVKEGQPGMVMCSYNKLNGDWACENAYLLDTLLKKTWGFPGFVISDWGGTHSTAKAARRSTRTWRNGSPTSTSSGAIRAGASPSGCRRKDRPRLLRPGPSRRSCPTSSSANTTQSRRRSSRPMSGWRPCGRAARTSI